ncbi:MAG: CHAT domain-containing protein [Spirulina sp. SIO3F2]|nr:CHAT domain-containing protein [Spirulina sp. SIO3F2]
MSILTIRERHALENGFAATLAIDHQTPYDITVRDPFDAKQERELEFYFEEWIQFPFDGQVTAQRAAASITAYGEALFEQVFEQRKAYSAYERACQAGMSSLAVEIISDSPEFQAFHWEALKDPDLAEPLAVSGVMTRKRVNAKVQTVNLKPSPMINLLVVTARPGEENDVGYRTISRPLIDAIQQAKLRVNVELLRPGTFEALVRQLSAKGKEGYYHIVHFDLHGGLLTYEQFQNGVENNRYIFRPGYGQTELEPYEGWQAFLCFESDQQGQTNLVSATDLAQLLEAKGIPICILNACQSGKQVRGSGFKVQGSELGGEDGEESPLAPLGKEGTGERPLGKGGKDELPLTKGDAAGRGISESSAESEESPLAPALRAADARGKGGDR